MMAQKVFIIISVFTLCLLSEGLNVTCPKWAKLGKSTCGNKTTESPDVCNCDDKCQFYGDCCMDHPLLNHSKPRAVCQFLFRKSFYVINTCPVGSWTGTETEARCNLTKGIHFNNAYLNEIYVFSESTNHLYQNVFCAICNNDNFNLKDFKVSITCVASPGDLRKSDKPPNESERNVFYNDTAGVWQLQYEGKFHTCTLDQRGLRIFTSKHSQKLRSCITEAVDQCPIHWTNQTVRDLCWSIADNPLYGKPHVYKNHYCAICNQADEPLSCTLGPIITVMRSGGPMFSFKHLLDVKFSVGNLVGLDSNATCSLSDGQVYDPIKKDCIDYGCPKMFIKMSNGKCVLKQGSNISLNDTLILKPCKTLTIDAEKYVRINNTSIYVNFTNRFYGKGRFEFSENGSVRLCHTFVLRTLPLNSSFIENILSFGCLLASITCLSLYILMYIMVSKLRTESGKLQIAMTTALLCAHLSFAIATNTKPSKSHPGCVMAGVAMHYFYLCSFFWMNILAFDIWCTFGTKMPKRGKSKRWSAYLFYGWGLPGLIVATGLINEFLLNLNAYQPWYGLHICWINQKSALFVLFVAELLLVMILNLILFGLTVRGLRATKAAVRMASIKERRISFKLYVKLAVIMGLTWVFGFAASLVDLDILWYPFMVLNGLQGVLIFIGFGCQPANLRSARGSLARFWGTTFTSTEKSSSERSKQTH